MRLGIVAKEKDLLYSALTLSCRDFRPLTRAHGPYFLNDDTTAFPCFLACRDNGGCKSYQKRLHDNTRNWYLRVKEA